MEIGIIFPQTEFGSDPVAIRDFAQTAESLGFSHILAYDHILGANPDRPGWRGFYTHESPFLSPFLLFSHMAAVTERIGFLTGILVLPQRQTPLVAKQAATLDRLCEGRFRLGVGVGWNSVEFAGLDQDFHNRGQRIEEQIRVLRALWTQPLVTFKGQWHAIPDAGINPLPIQQPIPVWFGGHATQVLRRAARMGDGWLPTHRSVEDAKPLLEQLAGYLDEEQREPGTFGIEARLQYGEGNAQDWVQTTNDWARAGATHLSINTMRYGLEGPQRHLQALERLAEALL